MPFEHKSKPLLPIEKFYVRVLKYACFAFLLIIGSLLIGIMGYHYFNDLPWIDSLVNASMILTGMGPVDLLKTDEAKYFASFYAIFSGIGFLSTVAVFLAPVVHRFFHKLHINDQN